MYKEQNSIKIIKFELLHTKISDFIFCSSAKYFIPFYQTCTHNLNQDCNLTQNVDYYTQLFYPWKSVYKACHIKYV